MIGWFSDLDAMTLDDLQRHYDTYYSPNNATLVKDRATGAPRGFGFVDYPNDAHAQAAIAGLNGKEVNGHVLKVNESRPKI